MSWSSLVCYMLSYMAASCGFLMNSDLLNESNSPWSSYFIQGSYSSNYALIKSFVQRCLAQMKSNKLLSISQVEKMTFWEVCWRWWWCWYFWCAAVADSIFCSAQGIIMNKLYNWHCVRSFNKWIVLFKRSYL